jgi:hypothetical protein
MIPSIATMYFGMPAGAAGGGGAAGGWNWNAGA